MSDTTAITRAPDEAALSAETLELVLGGDLSKLTARQRVEVYLARCSAAGLDPRTQPFSFLQLSGRLVLYATKTATDQLCQVRGISTTIVSRERVEDVLLVTCRATAPDGRSAEDLGAVTVGHLQGDALANGIMKAVTKSRRRAVLSLCGLGMLDETETETAPGARSVPVDLRTGELLESTGDQVATVAKDAEQRTRERFFALFHETFPKCSDAERHAILTVLRRQRNPEAPAVTTQADWSHRNYQGGVAWLERLDPRTTAWYRQQARNFLDAQAGTAPASATLETETPKTDDPFEAE